MRYRLLIPFFLFIFARSIHSQRLICPNEKAFISFKYLDDIRKPNSPPYSDYYYFIPFDSIRNLDQIDSLKKNLCKRDNRPCYDFLTVKMNYGNDILYLPLFSISCGDCYVDFLPSVNINLKYISDKTLLFNSNYAYNQEFDTINIDIYKVKLDSILQKHFLTYYSNNERLFQRINKRQSYEIRNSMYNSDRVSLYISIDSTTDIQTIKYLITSSLDIYFCRLRKFIKQSVNKETCDLTDKELELFSINLFFKINIGQFHEPIIVDEESEDILQ
jgi:hypothetical protein